MHTEELVWRWGGRDGKWRKHVPQHNSIILTLNESHSMGHYTARNTSCMNTGMSHSCDREAYDTSVASIAGHALIKYD